MFLQVVTGRVLSTKAAELHSRGMAPKWTHVRRAGTSNSGCRQSSARKTLYLLFYQWIAGQTTIPRLRLKVAASPPPHPRFTPLLPFSQSPNSLGVTKSKRAWSAGWQGKNLLVTHLIPCSAHRVHLGHPGNLPYRMASRREDWRQPP